MSYPAALLIYTSFLRRTPAILKPSSLCYETIPVSSTPVVQPPPSTITGSSWDTTTCSTTRKVVYSGGRH